VAGQKGRIVTLLEFMSALTPFDAQLQEHLMTSLVKGW
jgi:hypothetical protein